MHRSFSPARFYVTAHNVLLTHHCVPAACHGSSHRHPFATQTSTAVINDEVKDGVKDVAILGGGITGLACAYYLSRALPNIKITLLEGSSRLGGWLHTESVNVGNGNIIFEQGPRSLRASFPNGPVTLDLVGRFGYHILNIE